MENYFLTKKIVGILLENLNDDFMRCLRQVHMNEKYDENNKQLIHTIINEIQQFLSKHPNDITFGLNGKYKEDYVMLQRSLTGLMSNYLQNKDNDKVFITELSNN